MVFEGVLGFERLLTGLSELFGVCETLFESVLCCCFLGLSWHFATKALSRSGFCITAPRFL